MTTFARRVESGLRSFGLPIATGVGVGLLVAGLDASTNPEPPPDPVPSAATRVCGYAEAAFDEITRIGVTEDAISLVASVVATKSELRPQDYLLQTALYDLRRVYLNGLTVPLDRVAWKEDVTEILADGLYQCSQSY